MTTITITIAVTRPIPARIIGVLSLPSAAGFRPHRDAIRPLNDCGTEARGGIVRAGISMTSEQSQHLTRRPARSGQRQFEAPHEGHENVGSCCMGVPAAKD